MENIANNILKIFDDYDNCEPVPAVILDDDLKNWARILKEVPERIGEVPEKVCALSKMVNFLNANKDNPSDPDIDIEKVLCDNYSKVKPETSNADNSSDFYGSLFYDVIHLPALETFAILYTNKIVLSVPVDDELKKAMADFDNSSSFTDEELASISDEDLSEIFNGKKE